MVMYDNIIKFKLINVVLQFKIFQRALSICSFNTIHQYVSVNNNRY